MIRLCRTRFASNLAAFLAVCALLAVLAPAALAQAPPTPSISFSDLDPIQAPAPVAKVDVAGQAPNGSYYAFSVPDGWTPANGLVIWNHGYDFAPPAPNPDLGPLAPIQLSQGYAVAASSYSGSQWTLATTVQDLEQMIDAFHDQFGVPDFVLVYGASLGGLVTVQAIEQAEIGNVVGAMPICGALAGSRAWDGSFDIRQFYDFYCSEVPGAAIPGGETGLPFPPDPTFGNDQLGAALQACFGLFATPDLRTPEQQSRLDDFLALTQIPENFVATDMAFSTFGLFDLIWLKLGGVQAVGNAEVNYGVPAVDAGIRRVAADPAGRAALADAYVPNGDIGDVKIVSIHTDKDGLVLVENESDYAGKVPASQFSLGVVVEDEPTHCGFTDAETISAWESLRAWVANVTPQPTAAALQGACEAAESVGVEGPCRIDPPFVAPPISDRIRPRQVCESDADTLCLGAEDRFQVEVSWTDFDGLSGTGQALPQTDDTGAFYFFDPGNFELIVKLLDGRMINGRFWVFYGSLTNVEFTLTVTDTVTGEVVTYENPLGTFASAGDTSAF